MKENYDLMLSGLIKERERLLENNPELQSYQDEINQTLESAGDDAVNRCKKLMSMLMVKMETELLPAKYEVRRLGQKISNMSEQEKKIFRLTGELV